MPTEASIAANKVARAIHVGVLFLAAVAILITVLQQNFIIELIGDNNESPSTIRFVRQDGGSVVICDKINNSPEYICRRER